MSLLDVIERSDIEEMMRRHRPTVDGKDGSKERYAYIEWLGIYNAIRELPSVKYDSFCDVPMAEAIEVMQKYKASKSEPQTDCCETCKHKDDGCYSKACGPCSSVNSNYEPQTETTTGTDCS